MEITDVTIREACQMPDRTYSVSQRVRAGQLLDSLNLGAIQAGFPIVSEADRETVNRLAVDTDTPVVALARAVDRDVTAAIDENADIVEVFIPVSGQQLTHVADTTLDAVLESVESAIDRLEAAGVCMRLTAMDAFRTDPDRLMTVYALLDGRGRFGLADTVGIANPNTVQWLLDTLEGSGVAIGDLRVHFHDDLGLATANTLAAARRGVGGADVSVCSLGERAGNASLEQVAISATLDNIDSIDLKTDRLIPTCIEIMEALDEPIPDRAPVVGRASRKHETGIHTAAMLREPSTFEPYDPTIFGGERGLFFGSQTGGKAAKELLKRVGHEPTPSAISSLLDDLDERGSVDLETALDLADDAGKQ